MPCLDENELSAIAEGRLEAPALAAAEAHLDRCASCRELLGWAGRVGASGEAEPPDRGEAAPPEPRPGDRVGRYRLLERLGAGTMGVVYSAHDPELDRKLALKLIRPGGSGGWGDELRARLLREARAMARVSHPHVVPVYDVTTAGEQLVVAMELIEGSTAAGWLKAARRSPAEVLEVYLAAGRGLAAAHAAGLVHRDFKPDNVLVAADGRVKVTDFGLARLPGAAREPSPQGAAAPGDPRLTQDGALVGSPAYMAPEQLAGAPADARSDLFSFCVALWEALHGERPFAGERIPELVREIERGAVRPRRGRAAVPAGVRAALLRGLRARPEQRPPSMDALLAALARGAAQRKPRSMLVPAALLLAVLAGLGAFRALRPAAPVAPERLAVFPFVLGQIGATSAPPKRGAAHGRLLRERLPELIAPALVEAGLQRLDPPALARALADAPEVLDAAQAAGLARAAGAELLLTGDVVEVAGRLHVHAAVFEAAAPRTPLAEASSEGEAGGLTALAAAIARGLRPALAARARARGN